MTRDTVFIDTPASSATSKIVAMVIKSELLLTRSIPPGQSSHLAQQTRRQADFTNELNWGDRFILTV
jgi:hypothetical protein